MLDNGKEEKVTVVCCSGKGDTPGYVEHPKIYLTVNIGQEISCPYCSRVFTFTSND